MGEYSTRIIRIIAVTLIMTKLVRSLKHLFIKKYYVAVVLLIVYNLQATRSQKYGFSSLSNTQNNLASCLVPTGRVSYCVPLKRCKQINVLFRSLPEPRPSDITNFLSESFLCPNEKSSDEKRVCCPVESITNPKLAQRPRFGNTGNRFY